MKEGLDSHADRHAENLMGQQLENKERYFKERKLEINKSKNFYDSRFKDSNSLSENFSTQKVALQLIVVRQNLAEK